MAPEPERAEIDQHTFRVLEVQPLRDRLEELPELVKSIAERVCKELSKPALEITESSLTVLSRSSWPENIKGLVDVIGKGFLISHGDSLELPPEFLNEHQHLEDAIQNIAEGRLFNLDQTLYLIEQLLIRRALETYKYHQSKTAEILGLSEANFRYRLKKFKLPSIRQRG